MRMPDPNVQINERTEWHYVLAGSGSQTSGDDVGQTQAQHDQARDEQPGSR
jgi:hypothetical protein